jgi:hypothetical protein
MGVISERVAFVFITIKFFTTMNITEKIQELQSKIAVLEAKSKLPNAQKMNLENYIRERDEIINTVSVVFKKNFKKQRQKLDSEYQKRWHAKEIELNRKYETETAQTKTELEKQHEQTYRSIFLALDEIHDTTEHIKLKSIVKTALTGHFLTDVIARAREAGFFYNHRKQLFFIRTESLHVPVVSDLLL